tara:strand:- start:134 stop:589 length:456 start_codon:yes stop_codon:yes gene_type:complete
MSGVVNGTDAILLINGQYFIMATSHSISFNHKTRDITVRETENWSTKIAHTRDWSLECEGYFGYTYDDGTLNSKHDPYTAIATTSIFQQMYENQEALTVKLLFQTDGIFYEGECYLTSYGIEAPTEDSATVSISMTGASDVKTNQQVTPAS